jgi:hypothetical protein
LGSGAAEVFEKWILVSNWRMGLSARLRGSIGAVLQLGSVEVVVLLLEFTHLLNLVQVDHIAGVQVVQVLDALSAEDGRVLAAIEVLDALVVLVAQVWFELPLIRLVVLVDLRLQTLFEVNRSEQRVPRDHLVEDVEVERQLLNGLQAFEQFAAEGTPDVGVAQKVGETRRAERVAAPDDNTRNALTNIKLLATEVA